MQASEDAFEELENMIRTKLSKNESSSENAVMITQLIASIIKDKKKLHSDLRSK